MLKIPGPTPDIHYEFESDKGDTFLSAHDWALANLNSEELAIYLNEALTPEKDAIFQRWIAAEQISAIRVYVNNVLQS